MMKSDSSADYSLRKPNVTLVMLLRAGKITAIERKLINSILLSSVQQLSAYRALHGRNPVNTESYCARVSELLAPIEVGKSNLTSGLRKNALALRRAEIDWEAPDAKSGIIWSNLSILSQTNFELRNGSLYMLWSLPPSINQALSEPDAFPFTRLDLEQIALLKSYTAVALYEICARYRNNYLKGGSGECLTCPNSPEWWVDVLTNIVPKVSKETGKPMRREWRKVKSEAVKHAIEEINALTDLTIELLEKKHGKSIVTVQFAVRSKKPEPRPIESRNFELIKSGIGLGLSQFQVESGINQTSFDQASLCIAKLEARLKQTDLKPIENVAQYFASILKNVEPFVVIKTEADIVPEATPVAPAEILVEQAQKSPQTLAKESFFLLSEEEKRSFANQALSVLISKGVATPRILTNANAGVWSGVLLSQMVEIFTEESSAAKSTAL